jgi:hypothetical protein
MNGTRVVARANRWARGRRSARRWVATGVRSEAIDRSELTGIDVGGGRL